MSSVYVSEPATSGKVVLETTAGDLEIELWSREAPKACGESIYGAPFVDEFHSRLRFSRRGMLGMASTGPDANGSQFFITLAPTPELQKKNTLFATVVGDSLFSALKLGAGEVDKDTERPTHPKRIVRARVLDNPFADIVPRMRPETAAVSDRASGAKAKRAKAVKNSKLLSFADDGDDDDNVLEHKASGPAMKSSHDLLVADPMLRGAPVAGRTPFVARSGGDAAQKPGEDATQKPDEDATQKPDEDGAQISVGQDSGEEADKAASRRPAAAKQRLLFGAGKGAKRPRAGAGEDELLARLGAFQSQIRHMKGARPAPGPGPMKPATGDWLAHALNAKDSGSQRLTPAADDCEVTDPRTQALSALSLDGRRPESRQVNGGALEHLLPELVDALIATTRETKFMAEQRLRGAHAGDVGAVEPDKPAERSQPASGWAELPDDDELMEQVYVKLESVGFRVGQRLAERFAPLNRRLPDTLDVVKFVCKDVWMLLFNRQIDNLKTNHRGIYVLQDNKFKWFLRMSGNGGGAAAARRAQPYIWLPCGVIRGILDSFGVSTVVVAETLGLPQCTFQIKVVSGD
ncbi:Peptidyl-prolyl isomerase cwc27 [Coemansia biformis]|uniref:Peptidyl-prolyl isomerase cwc27 n=1 Tax=Coemansia biformis TaxID=1286918 RepID=A0A9W7Y9I0_9FUNG|nr:Peptidyl-prolyl isomerase cwc27 [Coemansia biformis]